MALTDNLVAYYKLDETSGTSVMDAVTSGTGTLTNASQISGGKIGYCTSFSGTGYYCTCPSINSSLVATNRLSVNAWVYRTDTGVFRAICGERQQRQQRGNYYQNFLIASHDNNKLLFQTYGANNSGGVNCFSINEIPKNTRTMVTCTYDGAKLRVYINGTYENEANQTATLTTLTNSNLMIGRNSPGASQQDWNGRIDEVAVWNKTLSQDEITALYNGGAGLQYPFTGTTVFTPVIVQF